MHELARFIENHPHCTEMFCGTCGGLWIFQRNVSEWAKAEEINLVEILSSLTLGDLGEINDWQPNIAQILSLLPEGDFAKNIFPAWKMMNGYDPAFDRFLIVRAPVGGYQPQADLPWVSNCLENCLNKLSEAELGHVQAFLGGYLYQFPGVLARKQLLESLREAIAKKEKQAEEERRAFAKAESRARAEKLERLAYLSPLDRLKAIFTDDRWSLSDYPKEWADVSNEQFAGLSSKELTDWIVKLSRKISRRGKNPWRDLRSRLFLLRQCVYNEEHNSQPASSEGAFHEPSL
jgi:hypothetical protein